MAPWVDSLIIVLTQLFMLVGLIGLLVPIFPGITVMWLSALGYGVVSGFSTLGIVLFVLITLLLIAGILVDNLFIGAGARKGGASWVTIGVALIAGVLGTIIFPPFGGLIAAPLAVFILEYVRVRDLRQTWLALRGLAAGWGLSFIARFGIGMLMMIFWWIWVWKG
jgi:uncharacterized protein YqgC (DUF456 family)